MKQTQNNHVINSIFPTPVYNVKRDSDLDSTEEDKEIEDIIKEGMKAKNKDSNSFSVNTHIFNTKLHKLKKFIEEQLKIYVEKIVQPKEEIEFYITQSWLNITKSDQEHHSHRHSNSLISGVFYVAAVEEDKIYFHDPNIHLKGMIAILPKEFNLYNSPSWFIPIQTNMLLLFPSWLEHSVDRNINATRDRFSISFNTFAKGTLGSPDTANELIL